MRKPFEKTALAAAVLAAMTVPSSVMAEGAFSANAGFSSEYVFRGVLQADSSASVGLDYENSGFYVGTWWGDVDLGLEVDLYAGYGGEVSGVSYDLNYTTYNYTRDDPSEAGGAFDDTYGEFNLGLGYGPLSVGYADGTYDNFGAEQKYSVTTVAVDYKGFTVLYGDNGKDFSGSWFEVGYGTEIGDFDTGINVVFSDEDLDNQEYVVFSLGKTFDL